MSQFCFTRTVEHVIAPRTVPSQGANRKTVLLTTFLLRILFWSRRRPVSYTRRRRFGRHTLQRGSVSDRLWQCFDSWSFHVHSYFLCLAIWQCVPVPALIKRKNLLHKDLWNRKGSRSRQGSRSQSPHRNPHGKIIASLTITPSLSKISTTISITTPKHTRHTIILRAPRQTRAETEIDIRPFATHKIPLPHFLKLPSATLYLFFFASPLHVWPYFLYPRSVSFWKSSSRAWPCALWLNRLPPWESSICLQVFSFWRYFITLFVSWSLCLQLVSSFSPSITRAVPALHYRRLGSLFFPCRVMNEWWHPITSLSWLWYQYFFHEVFLWILEIKLFLEYQ